MTEGQESYRARSALSSAHSHQPEQEDKIQREEGKRRKGSWNPESTDQKLQKGLGQVRTLKACFLSAGFVVSAWICKSLCFDMSKMCERVFKL